MTDKMTEEFSFTSEEMFEHALHKIGAEEILEEKNEGDKKILRTLKREFERLKKHHLAGADHTHEHAKHAKLEPHSMEGWFLVPSDLHSWGPTHVVEEDVTPEGHKVARIHSKDGSVTYNVKGQGHVSLSDVPHQVADSFFRDFCTQAAIICGCKIELISELRLHNDALIASVTKDFLHGTVHKALDRLEKTQERAQERIDGVLPQYTPAPYTPTSYTPYTPPTWHQWANHAGNYVIDRVGQNLVGGLLGTK